MHSDIRELLVEFFNRHENVNAVRWYQSPDERLGSVYAEPDADDDISDDDIAAGGGDYEEGFYGPLVFAKDDSRRAGLIRLAWNLENFLEGTVVRSEMVEVDRDLNEHREAYTPYQAAFSDDEDGDYRDI